MAKIQNSNFSLPFTPAQLRNCSSSWYVEFYFTDPYTDKRIRKRIKINHIKSLKERREYGKLLVNKINQDLYAGKNPIIEHENPKMYKLMFDVLDTFIIAKEKELRPDSMRSYRSYVKRLKEWILANKDANRFFVSSMTKSDAIDFLEHYYTTQNLSNKTYNNYLGWFTSMFNWLKSMNYININVFEGLKGKKQQAKNRILIDDPTRIRIKKWLKSNSHQMYIASLLVYHGGIRPGEITFLKGKHINLANQTIMVPATAAKNGQMRISTIPSAMMPDLIEYLAKVNITSDEYLIGHGFENHKKQLQKRIYQRTWGAMRKELQLDATIKFYSLRDTGIVNMISDGIPLDDVMKQFGHSSLEITSIYIKHAQPKGSDKIKTRGSEF